MIPVSVNKTIANYRILSLEYGQWNSIKRNMCVDAQKNPIPWYTYPAIEYLKQFDMRDKTIFEFGSGNSSLFWAQRAKEIISVEDNLKWYEIVCSNKLENQEIILEEQKEGYISHILTLNDQFDLIVIDGKHRYDCSKNAVKCLRDGGMIILDNSDWFPKTSKYLRDKDLIEVDFSGFGPINNYTWTTSIYLTRNFGFTTTNSIQPLHSIGSIKQYSDDEKDIYKANSTKISRNYRRNQKRFP